MNGNMRVRVGGNGKIRYYELDEPGICLLCEGDKGYYIAEIVRDGTPHLYTVCAYCMCRPDVDSKIRDLKL